MVLDTFKHQLTIWGPHNGVDLVNIGLIHVGEILMHLVTKFTVNDWDLGGESFYWAVNHSIIRAGG